jgi:hypothetical protein
VIKFEAIADTCRPMAALLLASSAGPGPSASELAAARTHLTGARSASGRIGWAVRIILEGATVGSRMEQAIDIVVRVAGYGASSSEHNWVNLVSYRNVLHELLATTESARLRRR